MGLEDVTAGILGARTYRPQAYDQADPLDYRLAFSPHNDVGNAERLLERSGNDMIWVEALGWLVWNGRHWDLKTGKMRTRQLAVDAANRIYDEVTAVQDAPKDKQPGKEFASEHMKWARASGDARRLSGMLAVAADFRTREADELDNDPLLINLGNGTLALEGSCETLRPHRREDLLTKIIDIPFDPDATCPTFRAFLDRVLPDREVQDFMQRSLGYSLTGEIGEQCMWMLHGAGANGKSTLIDLVARILGPYAASIPFASLVSDERKRGSEATPDLARLPGARMVRASEPRKGVKLGEDTVKQITGGEPLTVRHLNRDFFEFLPAFKVFVSVNHLPTINGTDEGIWRRIHRVPFTVIIPKEERDPKLGDKLWAERCGVLNWLLDGCRMWLDGRLRPPAAVAEATRKYRTESDALGQFTASWTEPAEGCHVQATRLYEAYQVWCEVNAVEPLSLTLFGRMLVERGFDKEKQGVIVYRGLQLTQQALDELQDRDSRRHRKSYGSGSADDA